MITLLWLAACGVYIAGVAVSAFRVWRENYEPVFSGVLRKGCRFDKRDMEKLKFGDAWENLCIIVLWPLVAVFALVILCADPDNKKLLATKAFQYWFGVEGRKGKDEDECALCGEKLEDNDFLWLKNAEANVCVDCVAEIKEVSKKVGI